MVCGQGDTGMTDLERIESDELQAEVARLKQVYEEWSQSSASFSKARTELYIENDELKAEVARLKGSGDNEQAEFFKAFVQETSGQIKVCT